MNRFSKVFVALLLSLCMISSNGIVAISYATETSANPVASSEATSETVDEAKTNNTVKLQATKQDSIDKTLEATDKINNALGKLDKGGGYSSYASVYNKVIKIAKLANGIFNVFRGNGFTSLLSVFSSKKTEETYNIEVGINQLKQAIDELDSKLDDVTTKLIDISVYQKESDRTQTARDMSDSWFKFVNSSNNYSMETLDGYLEEYEAVIYDSFVTWYKDPSARGKNSSIYAHYFEKLGSDINLDELPIAFNGENVGDIKETDTGVPVVETLYMSESDLASLPAYSKSMSYETLVQTFIAYCKDKAKSKGYSGMEADAFGRAMFETLINRLGYDIIEKKSDGYTTSKVSTMVRSFESYLSALKTKGQGLDAQLQMLYNTYGFESEAKDSINSVCDLLILKTTLYGSFIQEVYERQNSPSQTKMQEILDAWMDTIIWIDDARNNALTGYDNYCYLTNSLVEIQQIEYADDARYDWYSWKGSDDMRTMDFGKWVTRYYGAQNNVLYHYKDSNGEREDKYTYKKVNITPDLGVLDDSGAVMLYHLYNTMYKDQGSFAKYISTVGADKLSMVASNSGSENWPIITKVGVQSDFNLADRLTMKAHNVIGSKFNEGQNYTIWDSSNNTNKFKVHDKITGNYMDTNTGQVKVNMCFAAKAVYQDSNSKVTEFYQPNLTAKWYTIDPYAALNSMYNQAVELWVNNYYTLGLYKVPSKTKTASSSKISKPNPLANYKASAKKWKSNVASTEIKNATRKINAIAPKIVNNAENNTIENFIAEVKAAAKKVGAPEPSDSEAKELASKMLNMSNTAYKTALKNKKLKVSDPMNLKGNKTKLYKFVKSKFGTNASNISKNDKFVVSYSITPTCHVIYRENNVDRETPEFEVKLFYAYDVAPTITIRNNKTNKIKKTFMLTQEELSKLCKKFSFRLPIIGKSNTVALSSSYNNWNVMKKLDNKRIKASGSGNNKYISISSKNIGAYCVEYTKVSVPNIAKLKGDNKQFTVTIGNSMDDLENGEQVRYSTKSSMKNAKSFNLSKQSTRVVKKLKNNKKYYVQARAYTLIGKKKVYSSWSKKKTVLVKPANEINVTYHYLDIIDGVTLKWNKYKNANKYQIVRDDEVIATVESKKGQKKFSFNDPIGGENGFDYSKNDKYQIKAYVNNKYIGKSEAMYLKTEYGHNGEAEKVSVGIFHRYYSDVKPVSKGEIYIELNSREIKYDYDVDNFHTVGYIDYLSRFQVADAQGNFYPNTKYTNASGQWTYKASGDVALIRCYEMNDSTITVQDGSKVLSKINVAYGATKVDSLDGIKKDGKFLIGLFTEPDGGLMMVDSKGNFVLRTDDELLQYDFSRGKKSDYLNYVSDYDGTWLGSSITLYPRWADNYVGGRIFYVDSGSNGATYSFYDENGEELNPNDLDSISQAKYYSKSGSSSKDKFYAYATTNGGPNDSPKVYSNIRWGAYDATTGLTDDSFGSGKSNTAQALQNSACLKAVPGIMDFSYWGSGGLTPWEYDSKDSIWTCIKNINSNGLNDCKDWFIGTPGEYNKLLNSNNPFKDYLVNNGNYSLCSSSDYGDKQTVWRTRNGLNNSDLFKWVAEESIYSKLGDGSIVPIRSF